MEWGRRVAAHGYDVLYAEDVRVRHPARRTLAELRGKVSRVAGGEVDMARSDGTPGPVGDGRRILSDFVPPVRFALAAWADESLPGPSAKLKVIFVIHFVRFARAAEKVRLLLGGTSRR
jgi:hypothetical protein